jgi:hypothetical protein
VRALSCLYFPEAPWFHKLLALFTVPALEYPFGSCLPDACHQERGPPKPYKDLVKLFVHAYDCCVDYNPAKLPSRAVLAFDHISLNTTISPIVSSAMELQLELRDGYAYLLDKSTKIGFCSDPQAARFTDEGGLASLPAEYLHHIPSTSFMLHLEDLGFARVLRLHTTITPP